MPSGRRRETAEPIYKPPDSLQYKYCMKTLYRHGCPRSLAFGDRGVACPKLAKFRQPHRRWLADYFPISSHNDPRSLPSNIVRHVLFAPPVSRKPPEVAKKSRNSLSWRILQGTSLFSIFYSAT